MRSEIRILLLSTSTAGLLLISLAGCPNPSARSRIALGSQSRSRLTGSRFPAGTPCRPAVDVASRESLLIILAFRGGTLAKVGHNHVIASHDVSGAFYLPDDVSQSTFELHVPVAQLAIDEPGLRSKEGPDFPADVPDSAKEGTRRNMLSEALLNGTEFPEITLVSQHIEATATASQVRADVQVTVRGQTIRLSVPVVYSLVNDELTASGELPIKQTDLGLTPFTALLGALAVQDELRVRFRFIAHAAQTKGAAGT